MVSRYRARFFYCLSAFLQLFSGISVSFIGLFFVILYF